MLEIDSLLVCVELTNTHILFLSALWWDTTFAAQN